jgi:hypothetical protein
MITSVVFRLSPCFTCRLDSFGYFPGVKFLLTDVSENSVVSIIKGANEQGGWTDSEQVMETSITHTKRKKTRSDHPAEYKQHSERSYHNTQTELSTIHPHHWPSPFPSLPTTWLAQATQTCQLTSIYTGLATHDPHSHLW